MLKPTPSLQYLHYCRKVAGMMFQESRTMEARWHSRIQFLLALLNSYPGPLPLRTRNPRGISISDSLDVQIFRKRRGSKASLRDPLELDPNLPEIFGKPLPNVQGAMDGTLAWAMRTWHDIQAIRV